jgi:hypothetical protein
MNNEDIRTMLVIQTRNAENKIVNLLIVAGDKGYVASCDLSTGVWCNYGGSRGNIVAKIYNNGSAMGSATIYCSTHFENELDSSKNTLLFAGGDGKLCCYHIGRRIWYNFDNANPDLEIITNDGHSMGYKAILTMTNYRNDILFLTGIAGHVCACRFGNKTFIDYNDAGQGMHNDGESIGNVSIYASGYINSIYVIAGEKGHVATYDITNGAWTSFDQTGFSSKGEENNYKNISTIEPHDNHYMIFGGDEGVVSSYNILSNTRTPYNDTTGICNTGSFIKNSISTIIKYNSILYFSGKLGNVIYKYHTGDIMLDENNKFIVEKPSELEGVIKSLPVYDRIYGIKSSYFGIIESYNNMIDTIKTLAVNFPQGCRLTLGIKNTSGKSSTFKFINIKTKEEYLDSLSLSISLGVKFDDNVSDDNKKYLVSEINNGIHCCPVKMSRKQNSLYFDLLNGIKKTSQIHIPEGNTGYDTGL